MRKEYKMKSTIVKITTPKSIVLLLIVATLFASKTNAQDLKAYTKPPAPGTFVYLSWTPDTASAPVRYNIYRKLFTDASFPATPLNSSPIAPVTNCVQFKVSIPMASADWNLIANAFADSVTHLPLANVCNIANFVQNSKSWNRAMIFARAKKQVGIVMGFAYQDNSTTNGQQYVYRIRRVNNSNSELPSIGADEATITAGTPIVIPTPANLRIVVGDAKLQLLWNKPTDERFRAFNVYRAAGGPFRRVNETDISADITYDLDSNSVAPSPANGFTDYERWDSSGHPQARSLSGIPGTFSGPANGSSYSYKITLKDILGNESAFSSTVSGIPIDKTPPATPMDITVAPSESTSSFEIRWPKITHDALGHDEHVTGYRVYHYASGTNPADANTPLGGVVAQPADSTIFLKVIDHSAGLRNPCKDSTHWYRVVAIDNSSNLSQRSVAVSGVLRDTTKPEPVRNTIAKGFDDYIKVQWKPNSDCNIDQYLIYRALCDFGDWIPCDTTSKERNPNNPAGAALNNNAAKTDSKKGPRTPKDCGGPFALIGVLSHHDARERASSNGGLAYYDDHTVPSSSPICYAYLVKAQDLSQNISGTFPVPTEPPEIVVCERLRDKTPPPAGIIAGLFSRDSAIKIDFIGQPVQDIAAYHIYRADSVNGTYHWAGGLTIEPPPLVGHILTSPYHAPPSVGCDSIPLVSNPYMSAGTFVDKKVERKKIYWYKVTGVDRNGNETPVDSAVQMSTFTFASNREAPPNISSVASTEGPCALRVTWSPTYDSTTTMGYVVFRSTDSDGPYFQLEGIVKDNTFDDTSVARGTNYYYRVALLKRDGALTQLSVPKNATHP